MTTPDYKALCAELVAAWDSNKDDEELLVALRDLVARTSAALAAEPVPPAAVGVLSCVGAVCGVAAAVELAVVAPVIRPVLPVLPGVTVLVPGVTLLVPITAPGVTLLVPVIWPADVGGVNTELADVPVSITPLFLVVGLPPHWFQRVAV